MKIPFLITIFILWTLEILSVVARTSTIDTGLSNVYTISAIITMITEFAIGVFFIVTGIRMLKISSGMKKAKFKRVKIVLLFSA
jgi:hypothetical protein